MIGKFASFFCSMLGQSYLDMTFFTSPQIYNEIMDKFDKIGLKSSNLTRSTTEFWINLPKSYSNLNPNPPNLTNEPSTAGRHPRAGQRGLRGGADAGASARQLHAVLRRVPHLNLPGQFRYNI